MNAPIPGHPRAQPIAVDIHGVRAEVEDLLHRVDEVSTQLIESPEDDPARTAAGLEKQAELLDTAHRLLLESLDAVDRA